MTLSRGTKVNAGLLLAALAMPLIDPLLPVPLRFAELMRPIFIFAILGMGLNIVTGLTGLLHLGVAAFMAIGAYTYAILTCDIYPFQVGFWGGLLGALATGSVTGVLLGLPTMRLRGDYLAIVTLGFGEIVQDTLRNLETITKGSQGINPLPTPSLLGYQFQPESYQAWYYLFLGILCVVVFFSYNLIGSATGRAWRAVRDDELAARCMGINVVAARLRAFAAGSSLCALAGALWACNLGSSGEPGNYDFQISVIALCVLIVGGIGSISGVLVGALIMLGFNSIILVKISMLFTTLGLSSTTNVFLQPNNWKYMIFGFALILMMRYLPGGLVPEEIMPSPAGAGDAEHKRRVAI